MAIMQICAVRDRAVDGFMQPFFVPAIGLALRSFSDEVNRPESPMYAHPEDYDLFHIGTYDDQKGALLPLDPRQLAIGKDMSRKNLPPTTA